MADKVKIGVIGCGYWGPNLIRNFNDLRDAQMFIVSDLLEKRLQFIKEKYPYIQTTQDYHEILDNKEVKAVAIATPIHTHYTIAKEALEKGKHVLLEKPMTSSVAEAEELIELAEKKGLVLMVDHTFIYTGAVRKIKELIDKGELGDILYFDSVRVNLGLFQHDFNVIWDLAPHDVSIMDYLLGKEPVRVNAFGTCHIGNDIENIAYLHLDFENNLTAHFHVNWLAPVKVRRIIICGNKKMVVYDDTEPSEKVKVYEKGIIVDNVKEEIYKLLIQYRTGDMYAPKIDLTEALVYCCQHFIDCINKGTKPLTDGYAGLRVVKVLEEAQKSIKENNLVKV